MLGLRAPAVLIFFYLRKRYSYWIGTLPLPSLWSGSLCLFYSQSVHMHKHLCGDECCGPIMRIKNVLPHFRVRSVFHNMLLHT